MQPNACLLNSRRNHGYQLPRGLGLTAKLVGSVVVVSATLLILLGWASRFS